MPKTRFYIPYFIFLCAIFIIVVSFSVVMAQTNSNTNTAMYPQVNFSTNKAVIYTGLPTGAESATLSWSTSGAVSCTASGGWTGTKTLSGTLAVSPSAKTTYTLACKNSYGYTTTKSVTTDVQAAFRRGDSNRDGKVDISDIVTIGNAINQLKPVYRAGNTSLISPCYDAADTDDNGKIDINDATAIINFLYGSKVKPALPGPDTKGKDPTADTLRCQSYP